MNYIAELKENGRLAGLLEQAGLRGRQLAEAFQFTKDSILTVLREELKKGNLQEVLSILKGKPLAAGKRILKEEITGRVVTGFMLRFGLRKIVAIAIAALIIPFVIGKLTHHFFKGRNVSDFIHSLNFRNRFQEIFETRNNIQPSPEPMLVSEKETNEKEFLTD